MEEALITIELDQTILLEVVEKLNTQNGPSGTFVLEAMSTQTNYPEIPTTAGQTFTYFFEGQRRTNQGGDPNAGWGKCKLRSYNFYNSWYSSILHYNCPGFDK